MIKTIKIIKKSIKNQPSGDVFNEVTIIVHKVAGTHKKMWMSDMWMLDDAINALDSFMTFYTWFFHFFFFYLREIIFSK